jgi:hypothetical protein
MDQEEIKNAIKERFNNLQPEIQEAIMSSNYEKNLYEIGTKYKLNIEQMGKLEFNTTLVLLGQTHPNDYLDTLAGDLNMPKETVNNIVGDVNEKIMKNIIDLIKQNFAKDDEEEEAFREIPLPPISKPENVPTPSYKETSNEIKTAEAKPAQENNEKKISNEHHEIYKNVGIEIMNDEKIEESKNDSASLQSGINMIKDKLGGVTVSKEKVSDYSMPKINNEKMVKPAPIPTGPEPKTKDPYHEPIE